MDNAHKFGSQPYIMWESEWLITTLILAVKLCQTSSEQHTHSWGHHTFSVYFDPSPKETIWTFYCWQFARVLPVPVLNRDKLNQIDKIHVSLCSGARAKRQQKRSLWNIDTKQTFAKWDIIWNDITVYFFVVKFCLILTIFKYLHLKVNAWS